MNTSYVNSTSHSLFLRPPTVSFLSPQSRMKTKSLVESDRILKSRRLFMTDGPNGSCKDQPRSSNDSVRTLSAHDRQDQHRQKYTSGMRRVCIAETFKLFIERKQRKRVACISADNTDRCQWYVYEYGRNVNAIECTSPSRVENLDDHERDVIVDTT
jgi:hypothetical protein